MVNFRSRKALANYAIALCAVALSACAVFSDRDELVGDYAVTGTNANGSDYSAEAEVRAVGENYYIVERFDDAVFQGPAEVRGGKLYWNYSRTDGTAIYDIDPDGTLEGRWGASENELTGTENWQRR